MKIHFLLNERVHPEPNPIFAAAMALLEQRGFAVTGCIAEEMLLAPEKMRPEHDLYVIKSQTELTLSVAGVLHDRGARMCNPYQACALLQNKITAASRLAAAQVPVPRSWVTGDRRLLRELAAAHPLIVKPCRGHRGAGIALVRSPADLETIQFADTPMLVQEFIPSSGGDLKVYVVEDQVFTVRKAFSTQSFRGTGVPCPASARVREIALRCGRAFGLALYGLDIVEGADGPVVVDVNYSPGFRGVPDVAPLIARCIEDVALGRKALPAEPPALTAEPPAAPAEPPAVRAAASAQAGFVARALA